MGIFARCSRSAYHSPASSSCQVRRSHPSQAIVKFPSLAGTAWQLSTLLGQPPIEGSEVTLSFQDGEVGGRAGCNSFGGQFSVGNDGSLNFQNLYNTEMFCMEPEGVMDQELAFLQTLSQASSYSITNDTLELKNAAGETILSFARQ
jgi:heat shock protein HslJ